MSFQDKRRGLWFFKKRVVTLSFLIAIILYLFVFGEGGYIARREREREVVTLRKEIQALKEKRERLKREIDALKHDDLRIEEEARELGMRRAGEKEVMFFPLHKPPD
jgi:cell division protein FtsB